MVRSQANVQKVHPTPIYLKPTIYKAKTLKMANKANQSIFKFVMNEQILGEINSDSAIKINIETKYNNAWGDDLIRIEDAIIADVIVDHLISKLNMLNDSIANSKNSYGILVKDLYPRMYQQKKGLISKYINAMNEQEKEQSVNVYAFEIIFLNIKFQLKLYILLICRNLKVKPKKFNELVNY